MIEGIGYLTVFAIVIIVIIYFSNKPNKEERELLKEKESDAVNAAIYDESRIQFINKYKQFIIPIFENDKTPDLIELKEILSNALFINNSDIDSIISKMSMYGMIDIQKDDKFTEGWIMSNLEYMYPNFRTFGRLMRPKNNIWDYSMMDDNPRLIELINSEYSLLRESKDPIFSSYFEIGLITNEKALETFGETDIFNSKVNLYIIANIDSNCKSYDSINKYASKFNFRTLLIEYVCPITIDLQSDEYASLFSIHKTKLKGRTDFNEIFGRLINK